MIIERDQPHRRGRPMSHVSRRSFVQAGVLGVGGLTLPALLQLRAEGAVRSADADKSVILFWLSGGPGHMETWDPKPAAPAEYRGPLGAIPTSLPGVQFGELMPEQARLMDQLAVLRTVQPRLGRPHQGQPLDAHRLRRPGLQRARQSDAAPAGARLRRGASCAAPIDAACRPTSPCRTCAAAPTTSSTTPRISAAD